MISEHITTISMDLISLKHTLTQSKRILVAKHLQEVNIMVVQHNLTAINANRYFGMNNTKLSKSLEKLSSGYAINRAGDNAAGLAVSEKMRAQISGINQGVKNAQDGISMVQTFEGALTETDSILQRMRTLATQSANGTYQDDVDREAIQLEYDQLNDELNQIADTDFNGVVVLNGGQMADGLKAVDKIGSIISGNDGKAVNGVFNYKNKEQQVVDAAKANAQKNVDSALEKLNAAKDAMKAGTNYDLSEKGDAAQWNTVDNSTYNKAAADKLWQALKLTKDGTTTGDVDVSKGSEVSITFKLDSTGKWTADSATVDGKKSSADLTGVTTANATQAGATGKGGFSVTAGGTTLANAIFDATNAKEGDTVTLTFKNAANDTYAPTNIGFDENTVKITTTGTTKLTKPTLKLDTNITDANMTKEIDDALTGLENVEFTAKYGTAADKLDSATLGGETLNLTAAGGKVTINGQEYWVKGDAADKPTTFTISTVNAAGTGAGTALMTIGITAAAATTATAGSVSATISMSAHKYTDTSSSITATVGDDPNLKSSNALSKAIDDAKAEYDAAVADRDKIVDYETARDALSGVSVSDSNDASTATLTYTNNITLQVGARTKDSVNFTFKYSSNGLGGLKADMDCSARGLGTDKLSLASQESANAAIDKIDNALNKVSMVRGTFGAVQNRLEHKIDNLNTTSENLTSAESRIRDTNMAEEMMNFTKNQILSQASQSMLAQANQLPQGVLSLLQ